MSFRLRLYLHVRNESLMLTRFAVVRDKDGLPCTRSNAKLKLDNRAYHLSSGTNLDPVPTLDSRTYDLDYSADFAPSLSDSYSEQELQGEGELTVEIGYRFASEAYERDLIVRHFRHVAIHGNLAHDYIDIAKLSPPPSLNDQILAANVRNGRITKTEEAFAKTIPDTSRFAVVRTGKPLNSDKLPMTEEGIRRLRDIHRRICSVQSSDSNLSQTRQHET